MASVDQCSTCGKTVARVAKSAPKIVCHECRSGRQKPPRRRVRIPESACTRCGKAVFRTSTSATNIICLDCRRTAGTRRPGRPSITRWVCQECGTECEREPRSGQAPKYCGSSCAKAAYRAKRAAERGEFDISRGRRRRLYERDGWCCRICGEPMSASFTNGDDWSPTLDHVEPQSAALIPDHSDANLRSAHMFCNIMRSDGRLTDEAVRVAALARREVRNVA